MSIRNIVARGYGPGSTIAFVVARGYLLGGGAGVSGKAIIRAKVIRDDLAGWDGVTKTSSRVDETGGKVSGLTVSDSVDVLQVFGKTRTVATIKSALDFIGTENNVTLNWSSGKWLIDSSVTIPDNFANHVSGGCVFEIATGAILTFSGPVNVELSTKWFTGTVVCSLGASGFPGW